MIPVEYPEPGFRMKEEGGRTYLFDTIRKFWVVLTEEEWVRQNFIAFLTEKGPYPPSLIAVEKEIRVNGLKKRFDIMVYDRAHRPWLLVECKAPSVPLSEEVLQQALRYGITVPAPFILITNGDATFGWGKSGEGLVELNALPGMK